MTGYQWLRGGNAIKGARKATYLVRKADRGKRLACRVRAASPGAGQKIVQSNDVFVDKARGLVFLIDRLNGLDILEYRG